MPQSWEIPTFPFHKKSINHRLELQLLCQKISLKIENEYNECHADCMKGHLGTSRYRTWTICWRLNLKKNCCSESFFVSKISFVVKIFLEAAAVAVI